MVVGPAARSPSERVLRSSASGVRNGLPAAITTAAGTDSPMLAATRPPGDALQTPVPMATGTRAA